MGRKKKAPDFAALAAAIGLDSHEELVQAAASSDNWGDDRAYAAEARLIFHDDPKAFHDKTCKRCGRMFVADYKFVSLCSNRCRKDSLREIGIIWDESRPYEDRWLPNRPPLIVTAEAMIPEIPGQLALF